MFGVKVTMFGVSVGFTFGTTSLICFAVLFLAFIVSSARMLSRFSKNQDRLYRNEVVRRLNELIMFVSKQDLFCASHPVFSVEENTLYIGSNAVIKRANQYVKPLVSDTKVLSDLVRWLGIDKDEAIDLFYKSDHRSGFEFVKEVEALCEKYRKTQPAGYLDTQNGINFFTVK